MGSFGQEILDKLNELVPSIPTAPTEDGTYTLKVTVTSGEPTYEWVEDA